MNEFKDRGEWLEFQAFMQGWNSFAWPQSEAEAGRDRRERAAVAHNYGIVAGYTPAFELLYWN